MPNKHKGEVALTVDGKEYVLRLTFSKVAALEAVGINLFDTESLSGLTVQLNLFFVLVKGQHGVESIDDADELMLLDYPACSEAITHAVTLFFQIVNGNQEAETKEKAKP